MIRAKRQTGQPFFRLKTRGSADVLPVLPGGRLSGCSAGRNIEREKQIRNFTNSKQEHYQTSI